jgi:DNA-binding transcriptional ArsR family regulator
MTNTTSVARKLDALGVRTRRIVFERLRAGPLAVSEIARGLPVSRPAVSQHLRVLKGAGLVTDRAEGARRLYRIEPNGLSELRAYLDRFWDQVLASFREHTDSEGGNDER